MANLRKALAGPSDILSDIVESPGEVIMSSTQKDTSSAAPNTSSPSAAELVRKSPFRRRRISSPGLVAHISPVQKRAQEDTFQRMMRAQRRREKMTEAASAVVKSNWIDNQAEESDEDGGWAPVGGRGSDDEEEGEEDGYIADLVDDQAIDDEEKTRQDGLAAVKQREIELADDAKREAEAKKIIQGEHRVKRKGADFFSDDDDEEEGGGKRRKWSKKERRKRKLEREDGLDKLGEAQNHIFQRHNCSQLRWRSQRLQAAVRARPRKRRVRCRARRAPSAKYASHRGDASAGSTHVRHLTRAREDPKRSQ